MEKRQHWNGELLESEVWDAMEEKSAVNEPERGSIGLLSKQLQSSCRVIPVPVGKKKNQGHGGKLVQHSAPVNIPNWSNFPQEYWLDEEDDHGFKRNRFSNHTNKDGDYDESCSRLPPHEWLARKESRTQIPSSSVCEGVGRTLKGRDQTKVRHAVLTKTGFI